MADPVEQNNNQQPVISWPLDPITQQSLLRWLDEKSPIFALTDAANVLTDINVNPSINSVTIYTLTTTQNFTMANPTNAINGKRIIYKIKQNSVGSKVITWGSAFRGSTDVALPVLTTTANYVDYVGFVYDSAVTKWNCLAVNKGFAT